MAPDVVAVLPDFSNVDKARQLYIDGVTALVNGDTAMSQAIATEKQAHDNTVSLTENRATLQSRADGLLVNLQNEFSAFVESATQATQNIGGSGTPSGSGSSDQGGSGIPTDQGGVSLNT